MLHDKGDYGKGLAEFAKGFIEADKRAELALYEGITPGSVDYTAVVRKIKQSGAEAVIFGGYHPEASKIVGQMRKDGMDTVFISDDGVKDDTFIKVAGKYAEGVYATGPKDTSKNPMAIEAVEAHKKKYGEDPGAFFLNAYSAALALLNAIEKTGSTDYDVISQALKTEYVATPLGIIRFDQRGDAIGVGFFRVSGSKWCICRGRLTEPAVGGRADAWPRHFLCPVSSVRDGRTDASPVDTVFAGGGTHESMQGVTRPGWNISSNCFWED